MPRRDVPRARGCPAFRVPRVVYASTDRLTGSYSTGEHVSTETPARPDGFYGVSTVAGKTLCRPYADKFGISTISLRIGSDEEQPGSAREQRTWLSPADAIRAFVAAMTTPEHTAVFYATPRTPTAGGTSALGGHRLLPAGRRGCTGRTGSHRPGSTAGRSIRHPCLLDRPHAPQVDRPPRRRLPAGLRRCSRADPASSSAGVLVVDVVRDRGPSCTEQAPAVPENGGCLACRAATTVCISQWCSVRGPDA
ncbi:NAD-dependent epimerase/dehydratase family protein [Curtobacterium aetherium]|uniref:NAD-dependent epimerase/dehydratase family protein n=1 Tax=Curtobacterium aetherium TaxID=2841594 RepID=UPI003B52C133